MAERHRSRTPAPFGKPGQRGKRGFMRTSALITSRVRGATERRGFAQTRLLTDWTEIAGEALAKIARPIKVGYARQGMGATLTLLVKGADAPMVQMQLPQLIERVNACYGYAAISRIHITQTAASGFGDDGTATAPSTRPEPTAADRARVAQQVNGVANSDLHEALTRLGENIVKRNPKRTV